MAAGTIVLTLALLLLNIGAALPADGWGQRRRLGRGVRRIGDAHLVISGRDERTHRHARRDHDDAGCDRVARPGRRDPARRCSEAAGRSFDGPGRRSARDGEPDPAKTPGSTPAATVKPPGTDRRPDTTTDPTTDTRPDADTRSDPDAHPRSDPGLPHGAQPHRQDVSAARAAWTDAGFTGAFIPATGQNKFKVATQNPTAGACLPATATMTVTH